VDGDPGTGKSRALDRFGGYNDAFYLLGRPGMTVGYVREWMIDQTKIGGRSRYELERNLVQYFKRRDQQILFDECQNGFDNRAAIIEWLRWLMESSRRPGNFLILACHSSEIHRFSDRDMGHIASRIAAAPTFGHATPDDAGLYLRQLCEVEIDQGIVNKAHDEADGRYRKLSDCCVSLEAVAANLGKRSLALADVEGFRLCEEIKVKPKKRDAQ
jgi:hypothetical protein